MSRVPGLTLLIALGMAVSLACSESDTPPPTPTGALPERVTVTVGGTSFDAEVSETRAERSLGLGERDSLPQDAGMLFVFNSEAEHSFWMKGMRFPLDFIWISSERRVVAVTENVPAPEPGTPNEDLDLFNEGVATQYVLEVNAGIIDSAGIEVDDAVAFQPDMSPEYAE